MLEEWRHYKTNQSDIEISNFGNVRGVKWHGKAFDESLITLNHKGRRCIGCYPIYRLEWKLFNGPIPKGYVIHHKDFNKLNDRLDNLECLTLEQHVEIHVKKGTYKTSLGKKFYHKGNTNRAFNPDDVPEEWIKGKIVDDSLKLKIKESLNTPEYFNKLSKRMSKQNKNRHWYTNGIENKFTYECPLGFKPGCTYKKTLNKSPR